MAPQAGDTYTFPRAVEMPLGTANGVLFLNGSKVVTSGSALTFDGTTLGNSRSANSSTALVSVTNTSTGADASAVFQNSNGTINGAFGTTGTGYSAYGVLLPSTTYLYSGALALASEGFIAFGAGSGIAEQMRLTSTGLGIGTSSPDQRLTVYTATQNQGASVYNTTGAGGHGGAITFGIQAGLSLAQHGKIFSSMTNGGPGSVAADMVFQQAIGGSLTEFMRASSGNLGLGVTPSAWDSGIAALEQKNGSVLASAGPTMNYSANAYFGSGSWRYTTTAAASYFVQASGAHAWFTAPSGTAGNAISFSQALTLDANRNLALNTTSVGTSAAGVLSVGSGTEPSSGPADTVQFYSVDRSAGNTIPAIYCEGSGVTNAGITNVTVTNKIAIKINGTVYYLLATTDAT
jgi:hypothetical protein